MSCARVSGSEKNVYYGCVFKEHDEYYCFLPNWETSVDRNRGRLFLHSVNNQPIIGDRVDLLPRFATTFSDNRLLQLTPVGKFGLDEYYDLEGRCSLVEFDGNEKPLTNLKLVDSFRKQYLDYRKNVPEGAPRSLADLERLGLATDLDRALERKKRPDGTLSPEDLEAVESEHDPETGARKQRWCSIL